MVRIILLTLANLALPFLLFYLRKWVWLWWLKRTQPTAKVVDESKVPPMNWSIFIKLLALGVLLLAAVLFGMRLADDNGTAPAPEKAQTTDVF